MMNEQKHEPVRSPLGKGLRTEGGMNSTHSQEQMQREVDYVRAQQILTSMLEKGLITLSEFNKITELNRKTFSPLLAEIMP
ncbi:MAG: hypothetical protein N2171_00930 [Clostridia bacterium]|nr:hypothetical protein [Clostridia bacterium]